MTISAPNVGNTLSHMSALEHIQFKAQLFAKIKKQITLFNTYGEKDRSHSGKDKGTQTLITMIGLNSLNDAIELAGDNDHIILIKSCFIQKNEKSCLIRQKIYKRITS